MRKMATIRKIDMINPIEGADSIECATVGGWNVVVKRGEFHSGDLAVYCEIDSWIPHELAPFLSKGSEPREYNGVRGERLRTIKLRGQVSQGLLLKPSVVDNSAFAINGIHLPPIEGEDVSEALGVQKWEAPVPAQLAGQVKGMFPSFIRKTDQERIQNLTREHQDWLNNGDYTWEVTEKLDGSSMTVYLNGDNCGVCSRNLDLKEDDVNSFWLVAKREQLIEKIRSTGRNLALQGELIGESIQKNPYGIRGQEFHLFDIYDIDESKYLNPVERRALATQLNLLHAPVIGEFALIRESVEQLLKRAEGRSLLNKNAEREGLVFKCVEKNISFKTISNKFLLKNE